MTKPKIAIVTPDAPAPIACYSQGVRLGRLVQVSGQMPAGPDGVLVEPDIRVQTRRSLDNVRAILAAGGASFDDVIMTRVWLTDYAHFEAMNEVYRKYVGEPVPARMTCYVGLPPGMLVEVDMLAVLPG